MVLGLEISLHFSVFLHCFWPHQSNTFTFWKHCKLSLRMAVISLKIDKAWCYFELSDFSKIAHFILSSTSKENLWPKACAFWFIDKFSKTYYIIKLFLDNNIYCQETFKVPRVWCIVLKCHICYNLNAGNAEKNCFFDPCYQNTNASSEAFIYFYT